MSIRPLGEIVSFFSGNAWKAAQFVDEPRGMPVIRIQNVGSESSTDYKYWPAEYHDRYIIDKGDLLLTLSGSFRTVVWNGPRALLNQRIVKVTPKTGINKGWLFYALEDAMDRIANMGRLALVSNVALSDLNNLLISVPPLEEQKRISGILDQADALRRLRARALDKLNTLGQAIFYEMFGDPLVDHASDPDWVTETLDTNIHFIDYRGKTPPKAPNGVRLVTAKNVRMGYINPEPREYIEADAFDEWMSRGFPKKGDVLFTTEAPLGNVAILDTEEKLVVGQRLITLQPKKDRITSEYLSFFLRSPTFHRRMMENSSGSTVTGIKSKLLKKIMICYPSVAAQQKFSEAIEAATMLKEHCEVGSVDTEALFASLQHRAFRGEL